ncbi:MAG TPA: gfo/Idh/MocA family oxidoreductase, partial [Spirochaetia bacterium]|nr:gfo/Idh/MocA family oxidoreductase [Spirochaetia bacterium]
DIWTIPGEEQMRDRWHKEDTEFFSSIDATWYFFAQQEEDFANAILNDTSPAVSGYDGLQVSRIIEGIYRSQSENMPIQY